MVQGRWNITIKTPMGEKTGVLDLKTEGLALTGSMSDADHYADISDGKVQGNQLSWSAKITKPMRMSLKFTATVEADHISGAAKHLLGKATFTGTRA
jgi:subtilisin-like proprotein convertase family protein